MLAISDTAGIEGVAMPLTITSALLDDDGSETLTVTVDVSTLPTGTVLSSGNQDAASGLWFLSPDQLSNLTIIIPDDGYYEIPVTATATEYLNGDQASVTLTLTADVEWVALYVGTIQIGVQVIAVDVPLDVSVVFSDTGTLDSHYAIWHWGDGNICSTNLITDTNCGLTYTSGGSGTITGTHAYTTTGTYTITLKLYDLDDVADPVISSYPDLIVYDPIGGHVTGGGSIDIDSASCPPSDDPLECRGGQANHGFVIKHNAGTGQLEGQTTFSFKKGGLDFYSENSFSYLLVLDAFAQFGGTGLITYQGREYEASFVISIQDSNLVPGGPYDDLFGIRIELLDGRVIVDTTLDPNAINGFGMLESYGGSIVIH